MLVSSALKAASKIASGYEKKDPNSFSIRDLILQSIGPWKERQERFARYIGTQDFKINDAKFVEKFKLESVLDALSESVID